MGRLKKLLDPKTVCRGPVKSRVLEKALNRPPLFTQSPAKWIVPEEPFSVPSRSKEPPQVNWPGPRFRVDPARMERAPELTRLWPFKERTPPERETPPPKVMSVVKVRVPAVTRRSPKVLPDILALPVPMNAKVPAARLKVPLVLSKLPPTETLAPEAEVNWPPEATIKFPEQFKMPVPVSTWKRVTGPLTVNKWVPRETAPSNWMNLEKVGFERAVRVPV